MVELIIIDLDGTLIDTAPDIIIASNYVLREFDYPEKNLADVKNAIGRGVHELLGELVYPAEISGEKLESAVDLFRAYYRQNLVRESKPYPGVVDVLSGALSNIKKAVVTNKPEDLAKIILSDLGLEKYFDYVIGHGGDFPAKPNPSSVNYVIDRCGVRRENVVFIGDSSVDQATASNAGINFAYVSYGYEDLTDKKFFRTFTQASEWSGLIE